MELHAGPASHPECPQRHAAIVTRLQEEGLVDCCRLLVPSTVSREQVLRAHSVAHLDELARLYDSDGPAVQGKGAILFFLPNRRVYLRVVGCVVRAYHVGGGRRDHPCVDENVTHDDSRLLDVKCHIAPCRVRCERMLMAIIRNC